ncbi:DUF6226 family protein [Nocardioides litoris]|uniref:DUF6226 family protein n=1 Tax=Nocardioides litoris TaxID=1926648 RepID=UPI0011208303|nr:DUF6226 family protein [Nocardioides litoris]
MTWDLPPRPAWVDHLVRRVDDEFASTGSATPGWPDPHPDLEPPADEEYSRCLDPGKYRILPARVDAWALALADLGLATTHDVPARPTWVGDLLRPAEDDVRVRRITPTTPGALGVLLADTLVDGEPLGIDVGVAAPAQAGLPVALVASVPVCGCDACDDGSALLLEELDDTILTIALGGVVHARRGSDAVTRRLDGWGGSLDGRWLDPDLVAPDAVQRWRGRPWR